MRLDVRAFVRPPIGILFFGNASSPLTPTLSPEYVGEGAMQLPLPLRVSSRASGRGSNATASPSPGLLPGKWEREQCNCLSLPRSPPGQVGEGAIQLPLPLAGEGWGEGASALGLTISAPLARPPCPTPRHHTARGGAARGPSPPRPAWPRRWVWRGCPHRGRACRA
jgi:hypothetical protein